MSLHELAYSIMTKKAVGKVDILKEWINDPVNGEHTPDTEVRLCELQARGGDCLRCGKPWKVLHVKNAFAEYDIYQAMCHCYPVCPWCGRLLMVEVEEKQPVCMYCHTQSEVGYPLCAGFVTKTIGEGRGAKKKSVRCNGRPRPTAGGWICETCGSTEIRHVRID